jgi:hypothetical protein
MVKLSHRGPDSAHLVSWCRLACNLLLQVRLFFDPVCCFCRALQVCEQKPLYLALLGILERSGRSKLAGDVWRTATKKFNTSCKVWPQGCGL